MDAKSVNELMAKFLGWEKETYPNGSEAWLVNGEIARYVVAHELKFNRDWNELMKIVTKMTTLPTLSQQPKNIPMGWVGVLDVRITLTAVLIKTTKRINTEAYWDYFIGFERFQIPSTDSDMLETVYNALSEFIIWYYDDTLV